MQTRLINDLKNQKNSAFSLLYDHYFSMVRNYVSRNSGQHTDAEDIFQDTMLVLLEKLQRDNFVLTASLKTYVFAISKNLWLKKLRSKSHYQVMDAHETDTFLNQLVHHIEEESTWMDKLQMYMGKITNHCKGLITDMFFHEKSIDQIQAEYGYTTRHNAQNQKYKCMQQLKLEKLKDEQDSYLYNNLS